MENQTTRPRITEVDILRKLVQNMKSKGYDTSQIEVDLVRIAVVDLDALNEALAVA